MKYLSQLILIFLASCSTKQKDVGQFVYVDCFNTIHVDRECASTLAENPKTKEEHMANMQEIQFVDTSNLCFDSWRNVGVMRPCQYQFCPKCVDDEAYKHINAIMDRNTAKTANILTARKRDKSILNVEMINPTTKTEKAIVACPNEEIEAYLKQQI